MRLLNCNAIIQVTAVILLAATAVRAEDDEPKVNCAHALSTHDLNFCADREFAKADAELNDAYARALDRISKTAWEPPFDAKNFDKAMRSAQRTWEAYRDADCKTLVPMPGTGGSTTAAEVTSCMTEKTKQRTKELSERYLEE